MFDPEYKIGFQVLKEKIGLCYTLKVIIPAFFKSFVTHYAVNENAGNNEATKARLKNRFKLLALLYKKLERRYGTSETNKIMQEVLKKGGQVFMRGFTPLGPNDDLLSFASVYKDFERKNIVFDVVEESSDKFEIVVKRCLIYESFNELGVRDLTQWMCDIAFEYFSSYHPRIRYIKDRMIARGDDTCHEVFVWL